MEERYTNSIIDSTITYLHGLEYLAKSSPRDTRDIIMLDIIHNVYSWAPWFEVSESDKAKLQKAMEQIILNNSNLTLPIVDSDKHYFNVNIPQTIWTWQRVYDNLSLNQQETLT